MQRRAISLKQGIVGVQFHRAVSRVAQQEWVIQIRVHLLHDRRRDDVALFIVLYKYSFHTCHPNQTSSIAFTCTVTVIADSFLTRMPRVNRIVGGGGKIVNT